MTLTEGVKLERTTICVRSFNRPKKLVEAVESCLGQTVPCRILIVEDGSSHETVQTAIDLSKSRGNIQLVILPKNLGPSAALMAGIDALQTDFMGFLDSDDALDERFVERMEKALDENPWAQLAYCRFVGGPGWRISGNAVYRQVLRQGHLSALGTLFVRQEAIKAVPRLPTRIDIGAFSDACDDDRLSFELSKRGDVLHVPEYLYHYRDTADGRLTSNRIRVLDAWKKFYADYSDDYWSEVGGFWLGWRLGRLMHLFSDAGTGRDLLHYKLDYGLVTPLRIFVFCGGFCFALATGTARSVVRKITRQAALLGFRLRMRVIAMARGVCRRR